VKKVSLDSHENKRREGRGWGDKNGKVSLTTMSASVRKEIRNVRELWESAKTFKGDQKEKRGDKRLFASEEQGATRDQSDRKLLGAEDSGKMA